MSRFVNWGGKLIHGASLEPEVNPPAGSCPICGGMGSVRESIDSGRSDVMVTCWRCDGSGKFVKKP